MWRPTSWSGTRPRSPRPCPPAAGPHRAEAGIVSRKTELRELRTQAADLDAEVADSEQRLADLREQGDGLAGPIHGLEEEVRALTNKTADIQTETLKQSQRRERL